MDPIGLNLQPQPSQLRNPLNRSEKALVLVCLSSFEGFGCPPRSPSGPFFPFCGVRFLKYQYKPHNTKKGALFNSRVLPGAPSDPLLRGSFGLQDGNAL